MRIKNFLEKILTMPVYSFLKFIKNRTVSIMRRFGFKDGVDKNAEEMGKISHEEHLRKIVHKGLSVYCEKGFRVFNGHHNIFLGSNIFLVDSLLNAGDGVGSITIDDFVFFGHGVKILARGHDYNVFNRDRQVTITERPIHIKQGAWIGTGAIILSGVTIGEHSVVGAGSVVANDVPAYSIVAGNRAEVVKCIENRV